MTRTDLQRMFEIAGANVERDVRRGLLEVSVSNHGWRLVVDVDDRHPLTAEQVGEIVDALTRAADSDNRHGDERVGVEMRQGGIVAIVCWRGDKRVDLWRAS